jgi:enoyl-CoA hydratase/carnithine racemase
MPYYTITYSKQGHLARITLDRKFVDRRMDVELADVCRLVNQDEDIYVVVIIGAGGVFCRGVEGGAAGDCHPAASVAGSNRPVIAAIDGDALGEGLEIALSCDIRLASSRARFAMSQVSRGHLPADGGTQRLSRIVGRGKALELLLTAGTIEAAEALEIGLVSRVVPPEALPAETDKLAETIAARGPVALRYLKEAVNKGMDMTLEQGLRLEADLYFLLHTTTDRTEGITAFREKRTPEFKGK